MKENSQERTIEEACETLKRRLEEAEAIVVGAGAGLSSAAGMSYSGERFRRHFSDFERKYVYGRFLSVQNVGGILGVLEPIYLSQPLFPF